MLTGPFLEEIEDLFLEFMKLIAFGLEIEHNLLAIGADVISDLGKYCSFSPSPYDRLRYEPPCDAARAYIDQSEHNIRPG